MLFLRLDSVSVLTVNDYGDPVSFQSGHLLPPNADSKPYRVHPMTAWDRVDIDFNAEAVSLEEELGRVLSEASEAGDSPRAILVSVSPLPRAVQEMHIEELRELARSGLCGMSYARSCTSAIRYIRISNALPTVSKKNSLLTALGAHTSMP